MADDFGFEIEWDGLDELKEYYRNLDKKFVDICMEEMTDFGFSAEEIAKALAPHDTGELEDSITNSVENMRNTIFEVVIGTNLEYALKVHEQPKRPGKHPKYFRGVKEEDFYINGDGGRTRAKPKVKGYAPGRKYLVNASIVSEDNWNEMCERIITRVLEGS